MQFTAGFTLVGGGTFVAPPPPPPPTPQYLWVWGYNGNGQLGFSDTTSRSSPTQVGSDSNWSNIAGGGEGHSLAVKTDSTMWAWGLNALTGLESAGQLGLGDTTNRSSPTQVGALTNWLTVSAAKFHSAAIKTDGTLWTWGRNYYGRLGLGDDTNRSSPVQVGSLTNWSSIVAAGGYRGHNLAIKTDGTLWAWGNNYPGKLGLGNGATYSSPVQVGALTTWLKVSAGIYQSIAVKTDGTMWSWGSGAYGGLGLGNNTSRSSPTQIGSDTNWSSIAGGGYHSIAIKTDGTMWSWGQNYFGPGQLGLSDTSNRNTPTQIGALTTWLSVAAGKYYNAAIKTDGTLWSWGMNGSGQLGVGNTTNRSSPVQVGALTNWSKVVTGDYHCLAIST